MASRTYKIRKFQNGRNKDGEAFTNFSLTIPSAIAAKLPEDMLFECELTSEGILFRPAKSEAESIELPDWARSNGNGSKPRKVRS